MGFYNGRVHFLFFPPNLFHLWCFCYNYFWTLYVLGYLPLPWFFVSLFTLRARPWKCNLEGILPTQKQGRVSSSITCPDIWIITLLTVCWPGLKLFLRFNLHNFYYFCIWLIFVSWTLAPRFSSWCFSGSISSVCIMSHLTPSLSPSLEKEKSDHQREGISE